MDEQFMELDNYIALENTSYGGEKKSKYLFYIRRNVKSNDFENGVLQHCNSEDNLFNIKLQQWLKENQCDLKEACSNPKFPYTANVNIKVVNKILSKSKKNAFLYIMIIFVMTISWLFLLPYISLA